MWQSGGVAPFDWWSGMDSLRKWHLNWEMSDNSQPWMILRQSSSERSKMTIFCCTKEIRKSWGRIFPFGLFLQVRTIVYDWRKTDSAQWFLDWQRFHYKISINQNFVWNRVSFASWEPWILGFGLVSKRLEMPPWKGQGGKSLKQQSEDSAENDWVKKVVSVLDLNSLAAWLIRTPKVLVREGVRPCGGEQTAHSINQLAGKDVRTSKV